MRSLEFESLGFRPTRQGRIGKLCTEVSRRKIIRVREGSLPLVLGVYSSGKSLRRNGV